MKCLPQIVDKKKITFSQRNLIKRSSKILIGPVDCSFDNSTDVFPLIVRKRIRNNDNFFSIVSSPQVTPPDLCIAGSTFISKNLLISPTIFRVLCQKHFRNSSASQNISSRVSARFADFSFDKLNEIF